MRATVLKEVLRIKVSARLKRELPAPSGVLFLVIERIEPADGEGPNWHLSFAPDDTPKSYAPIWQRVRHEFEGNFNISDG